MARAQPTTQISKVTTAVSTPTVSKDTIQIREPWGWGRAANDPRISPRQAVTGSVLIDTPPRQQPEILTYVAIDLGLTHPSAWGRATNDPRGGGEKAAVLTDAVEVENDIQGTVSQATSPALQLSDPEEVSVPDSTVQKTVDETIEETVVEKTDAIIVEETIKTIEDMPATDDEPTMQDSPIPKEVSEEDSWKR